MQNRFLKIFQFFTFCSSIIVLLMLVLMFLSDKKTEWKSHQRDYYNAASVSDSLNADASLKTRPEVQQFDLPKLGRMDRCTTCHMGVENNQMTNQPLPLRIHSGNMLRQHPLKKYGCTICHGGQGQALDKRNAHATESNVHWHQPLLEKKYLQSSCGQCHLTIYGKSIKKIGAPIFENGLQIFKREGCLGCHKARGFGGSKGPDLSQQGEKSLREYKFDHVTGEKTVANWLFSHFKDPQTVSPGSQMLAVNLAEDNLDALITFTMGLRTQDIPLDYFSKETLLELKGERVKSDGQDLYSLFCTACHGKTGVGKSYELHEWGVPTLFNQDFLSVASPEFLSSTLSFGRSGKMMAAWTPRYSGIRDEEFSFVVDFIKAKHNSPSSRQEVRSIKGNRQRGAILYDQNCTMCHGQNGETMQIVTITNEDFLAAADDDFIYNTIVKGRRNTAMPAWGKLTSQNVADLIAYLRRDQKFTRTRRYSTSFKGNHGAGERLYHYRCSRCHGSNGEGQSAPAIANKDFLEAASDTYLYEIVAKGRRHTAMFGWRSALRPQEHLTESDIADIISFLRFKARQPIDVLHSGPNLGSADSGDSLYTNYCSGCHGRNGEGVKAPALKNQEFLNSATNGYLFATLSLGRGGTEMPSWGRGSEKFRKLSVQERFNITAALRKKQRIVIKQQWRDEQKDQKAHE